MRSGFTADDVAFFIEDILPDEKLFPSKPGWLTVEGELPTISVASPTEFTISWTKPNGPAKSILISFRLKTMSLFVELWQFLRARKKFWLLPIILVMLLLGGLLILAQGSAIAPFIYTLF